METGFDSIINLFSQSQKSQNTHFSNPNSFLFFLSFRYGSELVAIDSYNENNVTLSLVASADPSKRLSNKFWLGLASLDDLRTNTLESAAGTLVSQYSGFWSLKQPNPELG